MLEKPKKLAQMLGLMTLATGILLVWPTSTICYLLGVGPPAPCAR